MKTRYAIVLMVVLCSCIGRRSAVNADKDATGVTDAGAQAKVVSDVASLQQIIISDSTIELQQNDTVDLGRIYSGEILEKSVDIINGSAKPLVINSIDTNCGCITSEYSPRPIPPEGKCTVLLRYNSGGQSGFQFKKLSVNTSASDKVYGVYVTAEIISK